MSGLAFIIQTLQELRPKLEAQYHIDTLGVFGSYVRGEQHAESDLDMLVTFKQTPGLLRFLKLENELSDTLGVKVDLVMRDALKPHIGKHILDEVVLIIGN